MIMLVSPGTTPPISALALTQRQLADWQSLAPQVEGDQHQLDYCQRQIERLANEVLQLRVADIQAQINALPNEGTAQTARRYDELKAEMKTLIGY